MKFIANFSSVIHFLVVFFFCCWRHVIAVKIRFIIFLLVSRAFQIVSAWFLFGYSFSKRVYADWARTLTICHFRRTPSDTVFMPYGIRTIACLTSVRGELCPKKNKNYKFDLRRLSPPTVEVSGSYFFFFYTSPGRVGRRVTNETVRRLGANNARNLFGPVRFGYL